VLRAIRFVALEQPHHVIELVQELLEPELVDLVDDDEQHLVVLGSGSERRCCSDRRSSI
jgi:hypothetical protein